MNRIINLIVIDYHIQSKKQLQLKRLLCKKANNFIVLTITSIV